MDISQTIHATLPHFLRRIEDPYDINCGLCDDFASCVIDQLGGETEVLYLAWVEDMSLLDVAHAVICWESADGCIYFDAECPEGTDDLNKIPVVMNQGRTREEVLLSRP